MSAPRPAVDLARTPWVCMDCGATQADVGNCSRCGQGPLVDARDPAVQDGCRDADDRIRERHDYKLYSIAYGPVFLAAIVLGAFLSFAAGIVVFVAGAAVASVALRGLRTAWPAKVRFPYIGSL